ncbi:MAG: ParB/RepB/Spo0J family partition protein [Kiritimatiellales bacterium]|nr:ParB/RepB/Spo0J family partition protein [Kiritimatiellales bacterium]
MAAKHIGLGRGLDALIKNGSTAKVKEAGSVEGVRQVPVGQVVASPWQPRQTFDGEALSDLVQSVQAHGVLQPLLVREVDGKFELIAGERRLRAAQSAQLDKVPVIVLKADDEKALEIALIENLQREDLNPIEEAEGFALLVKEFNLTQEDVARRVGKARATIANTLRLLDLPDVVRQYVSSGLISAGHAKVLLGVSIDKEKELLAKRVIKEGLSVRALETIVKKLGAPPKKPRAEKADLPKDYLHSLSDDLHQHFGTSVRIIPSRTLANGKKIKGSLEIDFHDNDELDRLLTLVGYSKEL